MIIVPRLTQAGVWLVNPKKGEHLAYLVNNTSQMLRVNSRKGGELIATFSKVNLNTPIVEMESKVAEKLRKGYMIAARWSVANNRWKIEPGFGYIPVHLVAHIDTLLESFDLGECIDRIDIKGPLDERISLFLVEYKNGRYKINQFEDTSDPLPDGLPLWQTMFDTKDDAYNVLFSVRDKYIDKEGYRVAKSQPPVDPKPSTLLTAIEWASQPGGDIWF
jgi:hypothetical protein